MPGVTGLVELLHQRLDSLGPVPVEVFDFDAVVDDMVTTEAR